MSEPIRISSRLRDYLLEVRSDAWFRELASSPGTVTIVDENVWLLHRDGILVDVLDPVVLPIDEERKTFDTVSWLYDRLLERGLRRNGTVVSVGGGITQDLSGFAVSTLYRGVRWVYAPTTLLAQADSCIGGKTSLNYGAYKNILGTMYPPERIVVDPRFLDTLSRDDFFSGLGEVVKLHVLGGEGSARRLQGAMDALVARDAQAVAEAVTGSLRIKLPYIEEDEFDRGRRNMLNYGHCFGHALEAATAFAIPHGQAVVIGMLLAETVAERRGLASAAFRAELEDRLFLPVLVARPRLDAAGRAGVIEAMRHDKKRTAAGLALVMCCDDFRLLQVGDVSEAEALTALDELESW
jgi:3-dehydroquinate synthase